MSAFVGRETEVTALTRLLARASVGRGGLALLAGEAGIGKTRLLEELAAVARQHGLQPCWGRCFDDAGAPAFWPWLQALRAALRGQEPAVARAALATAPALATLLPELRALQPDWPDLPALPPEQARFRLFEAVTAVLAAVSGRQPLLLALDDLHWADASSLTLLQFVARELDSMPVVVIGAYRDLEVAAGSPLAEAFSALSRAPGYQHHLLRGLAPPAIESLLPAFSEPLDDDGRRVSFARELHHLTAGNPLFLHQTMSHLTETGRLGDALTMEPHALAAAGLSHGVQSVIDQRLDRLPSSVRRVLELAAVVGHTFDAALLARGFEDAPLNVLEALDAAARARLVVAEGDGVVPRYQFSHALIRHALYDRLGAAARARLHAQVGAALETRHGAASEQQLAELAWHFAQAAPAGGVDKAVQYAERAAEAATRVSAHAEAVHRYERALALLELAPAPTDRRRGELLLALGEAQHRAGLMSAGQATLQTAAAIARDGAWPAGLARAALAYGGVGELVERQDDSDVTLIEEALGVLDPAELALRARLLARLVTTLSREGQRTRSKALSAEALALAQQAGDRRVLAHALAARCYALWGPYDTAERIALAHEAIGHARATGEPEVEFQALRWLITALLQHGDVAAVDRAIDALTQLAERLRQPRYQYHAVMYRVMRTTLDGRLADAEELARQARAIGHDLQHPDADLTFALLLLTIRVRQGRGAEIEPAARALVTQMPSAPGLSGVLASVYSSMGRDDDARRAYETLAGSNFRALPDDYAWLSYIANFARVCVHLGDVPRAAILYQLLLPYAGQGVVSGRGLFFSGSVSALLGLLAATVVTGGPLPSTNPRRVERAGAPPPPFTAAQAIAHLEEGTAFETRMGADQLVAQTQWLYACFLLALPAPHPPRAADPWQLLEAALATARATGMARVTSEVERLLQRRPVRPPTAAADQRDAAPVFPDGLTEREVDVLRLLTTGMTNKEIAARLVVSDRTVGNHLANLYSKISARRRADATAYALRHGLTPPEPAEPD